MESAVMKAIRQFHKNWRGDVVCRRCEDAPFIHFAVTDLSRATPLYRDFLIHENDPQFGVTLRAKAQDTAEMLADPEST